MFELQTDPTASKTELYELLGRQAEALLHGEHDRVANAANLASLIWHSVPDLNWAGFYNFDGTELVLGPFQGKPACVRIPLGRGVCGTAAATRETQVVADVHAFPGHIACDAASNAEIVIPLVRDGELLGVLDIDSPTTGRFGPEDRAGFEALARIWVASLAPAK
ncbi:MAG: GAF domain-containing protein [Verrucomicrobia bacterium]|nr:GAF domain-containing protein [Verrucomicrobiota bacterium]